MSIFFHLYILYGTTPSILITFSVNFFFCSDVIREESIQQARFLELNNGREKNSRFGDVINLVNGKLENDPNGVFQLVEIHDNCIKYCLEESIDDHNITAFWSIYKIRHRDEKRGYRYEWKFTIRRLRNNSFLSKRNDEHSTNIRSFLLRDQDYPKMFEENVVKKKKVAKMEKRIFNTLYDNAEQSFNLDYRAHPPQQYDHGNLNTGEYYAKSSAPVIRYQVHNPQEVAAENANVHHHYFLNKNEVPIFKSSHYEKVATIPGRYNELSYSGNAVQPSQVSIPRVHNQLDSYGELLQTTSQTPFHFPNEVNLQEQQRPTTYRGEEIIRPTTYRGHYDDNRESILDGEVKRDNFVHHPNRNQLIQFSPRHTNVVGITSTPSTYAINLNTSPAPSIQSFYNKQFTHANGIHPAALNQNQANSYWFGQHPQHQNFNFVGSYPYHDDTFSEIDPIYHGPLATPSDIPSSTIPGIDDDIQYGDPRFVSQLPLQNTGDDISYIPTEVHQTTATNTDPSFTTPYNFVTTTNADSSQSEDKSKPYPDSINAQLPPPDSGADIRVPYVDDKSAPRKKTNRKHNDKFKVMISEESGDASVNDDDSDDGFSLGKPSEESIVEKTTKKSTQGRYKNLKDISSTEKPSWAPKRPRLRSSDKYKTNSELVKKGEKISPYANRRKLTLRKATTTTTAAAPTSIAQEFSSENNKRVTTSTTHIPQIEEEPRTTQSVQKSVSVHIAEKVTVMPRKTAKTVQNSSKNNGETLKLRRVARVRKVEKSTNDSSNITTTTEHSTLEQ